MPTPLARLLALNTSKRQFQILEFVLKQNLKHMIQKYFQFSLKIYSNLFLSLIISVFQYVRHLFLVIPSPRDA